MSVEVVDEFFGMGKVFGRFPSAMLGRLFVSDPFHQIFGFVADLPTVEDSGNFEFFLAFNLDQGRRRLLTIRNVVFLVRLEKVNMKHGMKSFHRARKSE